MITAAILWAAVGLVLCIRGAGWLRSVYPAFGHWTLVTAFVGIGFGVLKGHFVFSRLARRNVMRIRELSPHKEKICIFAFQAYQSYLIAIAMVALGIVLRVSPLPRLYLAGMYLLVGAALLTGSMSYMRADIDAAGK